MDNPTPCRCGGKPPLTRGEIIEWTLFIIALAATLLIVVPAIGALIF